jgi:YHS domain-containing protein
MIRNIFIFFATFAVGALIAFGTRAVLHSPDTRVTEHSAKEHASMVSNPLTPASTSTQPGSPSTSTNASPSAKAPAAASSSEHHAHHTEPATAAASTAPAAATPGAVNTVCAICGMKVDPDLPTLEYQGKKIGFGCKMCAPKFKANPEKYGPVYLKNEVIKR